MEFIYAAAMVASLFFCMFILPRMIGHAILEWRYDNTWYGPGPYHDGCNFKIERLPCRSTLIITTSREWDNRPESVKFLRKEYEGTWVYKIKYKIQGTLVEFSPELVIQLCTELHSFEWIEL